MKILAAPNSFTSLSTPAPRAWAIEREREFEVLARARALERKGARRIRAVAIVNALDNTSENLS
jgi:hypothetical protein